MSPQNELILAHLKAGNGITTLQAMNPPFNCCRLSERIRELERDGWLCSHDKIKVGKKHVTYYTLIGKMVKPIEEDMAWARGELERIHA